MGAPPPPRLPAFPPASVPFTGSNRAVADYLMEEVLGCLAERDRDFLLRTAILERMTGPLVDVLTEDEVGKSASRQGRE